MSKKYATLITSKSSNLGDEIQQLSSLQYLPKVDYQVEREKISAADVPYGTKLILNGWFMHNSSNWPPCDLIRPIFISFHARAAQTDSVTDITCNRLFASRNSSGCIDVKHNQYFSQFEYIGCRDMATKKCFDEIGIDSACFSGCLSLTLKPEANLIRSKQIIFVDPFSPIPLLNYRADHWFSLPRKLRSEAIKLSHFTLSRSSEFKLAKASYYLRLYSKARLVITSRLHVALPCIAFNTPVVFIGSNHRKERLLGYEDILTSRSVQDLLKCRTESDLFDLICRPDKQLLESMVNQLQQKVSQYIAHE